MALTLAATWPAAADTAGPLPEQVLARWQAERLADHPLARAARERIAAAEAGHAGVDGYFDTRLFAAGGSATWHRPVPGSPFQSGLGADTTGMQAGAEQPLRPGLFVAAGAAERHIRPGGGEHPAFRQSMAAVQLRVPLLRNRGHAQWRWQAREAEASLEAAQAVWLAVLQLLRFESETAFIQYLQAAADAAAIRRAGERVGTLLEQTETLVALQTVPEYQLFPSRMDAALREDEIISAEQRLSAAGIRLETLFGPLPGLAAFDDTVLAGWAERVQASGTQASGSEAEALAQRGDIAALQARIAAARAAEAGAHDAIRPELDFAVGATWQAERNGDPDHGRMLDTDDRTGYEAALVFRMPLQRRAERAALREEMARAAALEAELEYAVRTLDARLADSIDAVNRARDRMRVVSQAVDSARRTLEAEAERFRLGEGRSRNVLDAQKDLTAAELRRNAVAGALLQAEAALAYALGYTGYTEGERP